MLFRFWSIRGCICVAVLLVAPSPVHAADLHVDVNSGQDIPTCGSQASPCESIQQAVNVSSTSGDTIMVAEGSYTYSAGLDPCITETAVVCIVGKKLVIVGGYPSGNWVTRDPTVYSTIIDGENTRRGVLVMRTSPTSPNGANLVIDGFTIAQGLAAGSPSSAEDRRGGGLKAALVDSIAIRDVRFENNLAAGGDTAVGDGGNGTGGGASISTADVMPRVEAELTRVTFQANQARGGSGPERGGFALGGGLFINNSNLNASQVIFDGNSAEAGDSPGGGVFNGQRADSLGGGIAILANTSATIDELSALGNSSTGGDAGGTGGIGGVGAAGAIYVEAASLQLSGSTLQGNTSRGGSGDTGGLGTGGGLTAFDADVDIDRVFIVDNSATGGDGVTTKGSVGGGGAYLQRAFDPTVSASLRNSVVADNHVAFGTGGGTIGGGGGGLFVLGNDASIVHTTLARNSLGSDPMKGQAISVVPRNGSPSHADIEYTAIADHTSLVDIPAVQVRTDSSANFDSGLFAGNEKNTNEGILDAGTLTGLDTMIVEASADFSSPGSPDFDYHILGSSPAIDQATASTETIDIDDTYRNSLRDIGADEYCSAGVDHQVLPESVVNNTVTETACRTIIAGPYTVQEFGDVLFQAGKAVILRNGFQIEEGGQFEVVIELPQ